MDCDVLIVGGGINGVACARELALNPTRPSCILIEQGQELASGTSSRSSKLIHGGLRYLETLNMHLVRESLKAQRALIHDYPDLVRWV
ncbi:MAG: FAD-dependent oxidoreductase, partial [Gammaproteobacteria bacterium]